MAVGKVHGFSPPMCASQPRSEKLEWVTLFVMAALVGIGLGLRQYSPAFMTAERLTLSLAVCGAVATLALISIIRKRCLPEAAMHKPPINDSPRASSEPFNSSELDRKLSELDGREDDHPVTVQEVRDLYSRTRDIQLTPRQMARVLNLAVPHDEANDIVVALIALVPNRARRSAFANAIAENAPQNIESIADKLEEDRYISECFEGICSWANKDLGRGEFAKKILSKFIDKNFASDHILSTFNKHMGESPHLGLVIDLLNKIEWALKDFCFVNGFTLLHLAARDDRHAQHVQSLIEAGCEVDAILRINAGNPVKRRIRDGVGLMSTPLEEVIDQGATENMKVLLQSGARCEVDRCITVWHDGFNNRVRHDSDKRWAILQVLVDAKKVTRDDCIRWVHANEPHHGDEWIDTNLNFP